MIYMSTEEPIEEGTYWIKLNDKQLMIAEAVLKYEASGGQMQWVLQYNLQGTVYYDVKQPDPEDDEEQKYQNLKKGDIWVKINNNVERLAQQVGRWNGSSWIIQFQLADRPPVLYVSATSPSSTYTTDYWFKLRAADSRVITQMLQYQIDEQAERLSLRKGN